MGLVKLTPACKGYLWGGTRLRDEYHIKYDGDVLAEAWVLSCHPDGPSTVASGPWKGYPLPEYIQRKGKKILGANCQRFDRFPVLIKLIDAKNNLSLQVHPSDAYALKHEGQYGKTEMWCAIDTAPGASIYYGFKNKISKEEFVQRLNDSTILDVLDKVKVRKGDVFFIPSGTLHAINSGVLLAEIQQSSNLTYRVYDYDRKDKDGNKRELHIDKAMKVTSLEPTKRPNVYPHIGKCEYFTTDRFFMDGIHQDEASGWVSGNSFLSVVILEGAGVISCGDEKMSYKKGDSFFLEAGSGRWAIKGFCDALLTSI